jgi:hypothetical protein
MNQVWSCQREIVIYVPRGGKNTFSSFCSTAYRPKGEDVGTDVIVKLLGHSVHYPRIDGWSIA